MTRNLTAAFIAASEAAVSYPVFFFEGVFSYCTLRLWTGEGDIVWDGQTWQGNGLLAGFHNLSETVEIGSNDWSVVLAGTPSAIIPIALNGTQHNAAGRLWIGFMSSGSVVADPYLFKDDKFDHAQLEDGADEATLELFYSNIFSDNERGSDMKYDHETQQIFYPLDNGFNFLKSTLEWNGFWGTTKKRLAAEKAATKTKKAKGA